MTTRLKLLNQNNKNGTTNIVTVDNAPKTISTNTQQEVISIQKGTTPPDITQQNVAMAARGF